MQTIKDKINDLTNDLLYSISQTIYFEKKVQHKTRSDIAPGNEIMLSNITNYKILPKRNPYLLPNAQKQRSNNPNDEYKESITNQIIKNLKFKNQYNLIWGYNDSILERLFNIGCQYLQTNNERQKIYEEALLYSYKFAKSKAKKDNPPEYLPSYETETILENYKQEKLEAEKGLYKAIKVNFLNAHKLFFKDLGTKKIDQKIIEFIKTKFSQIFINFANERKGKEIYNLMSQIIKISNSLDRESLISGPEHQAIQAEFTYADQEVIDTGNKYINALIKMQEIYG